MMRNTCFGLSKITFSQACTVLGIKESDIKNRLSEMHRNISSHKKKFDDEMDKIGLHKKETVQDCKYTPLFCKNIISWWNDRTKYSKIKEKQYKVALGTAFIDIYKEEREAISWLNKYFNNGYGGENREKALRIVEKEFKQYESRDVIVQAINHAFIKEGLGDFKIM